MPDVTLAPVLIDTSSQESNQCAFQNPYHFGPFKIGSNLYCVLKDVVNAPLTINVFKSTDGGKTWTQKDVANSPIFTGAGFQVRFTARLNPDGTTITIAFNPNNNSSPTTLSFVTFSSLTDTFTVGVIPNLTNNDATHGAGLFSFDFVVANNGDILCAFPQVVGPNLTQTDIGFQVMSAGAWGAYVTIAAGVDATKIGWIRPALTYDTSTGIIHSFFSKSQLVGANTFQNDFYAQVSATYVVSGNQQVNAVNRPQNDRPNYGRPLIWQGNVCLPVFTVVGGGGTLEEMRVYLGTPLNAPVFTSTDFDANTPTSIFDVESGQLMVDTATGNLWAVWANWVAGTVTVQLRRSINAGGGWGPIGTFYDLPTNPPNPLNPTLQELAIFTGSGVGSLGVIIRVEDAANFVTVSYFLLMGGGAGPVAVNPKLQLPGPVVLPDPRVLCDRGQQKRCVDIEDSRCYTIQVTKGVFHAVCEN